MNYASFNCCSKSHTPTPLPTNQSTAIKANAKKKIGVLKHKNKHVDGYVGFYLNKIIFKSLISITKKNNYHQELGASMHVYIILYWDIPMAIQLLK